MALPWHQRRSEQLGDLGDFGAEGRTVGSRG